MVQGGMSLIKYLIFAFNFIFLITGIALIATGAVVQVKANGFIEILGTKFLSAAVLFIIVGCVIFFLAFLGCCGAIKENYCMVMSFAVLLCIIFILEIAGAIAAFVYRNQLNEIVLKSLKDEQKRYLNNTVTKEVFDRMQEEFKCCGVENRTEWITEPYNNHQYPNSCCDTKKNPECQSKTPEEKDTFDEACYIKFKDFFEGSIGVVGGVGIGLAFVQVLGIVFACCLARAIKKEYEVV